VKVVYFGTGPFGLPALEALRLAGHGPAAVVTSPDKPSGRGLVPSASAVKRWAAPLGIPVFQWDRPGLAASAATLSALQADVFVVIAYGFLLPRVVHELPRWGSLNVHASLLPRWRGAAPIQWTLWSGDTETGVTVIRLADRLDAGDVLVSRTVPVGPEEDALTLESGLAALGADALIEGLERLERGKVSFRPQDERGVTVARKITKEDGRIDWTESDRRVVARVRALRRWPVAWTQAGGARLRVLAARIGSPRSAGPSAPGTVLAASPREGLVVAAGEGAVELVRVQAEGRRDLEARDFVKGFPIAPGAVLE